MPRLGPTFTSVLLSSDTEAWGWKITGVLTKIAIPAYCACFSVTDLLYSLLSHLVLGCHQPRSGRWREDPIFREGGKETFIIWAVKKMIETKVGTFWIDSFVLLSVFPVYLFICSCEIHLNETYDWWFCLNVIFHQHVFLIMISLLLVTGCVLTCLKK